jgi:hypothetical protein
MVEYIKPVRPNAAPTKMIDSYYRPMLDNRESQALSKLASAIGNLRGPVQDLANTAMQAKQNELSMMKMEQGLQLQEQQNAFRLNKAENDFALQQARDNHSDAMGQLNEANTFFNQQAELHYLRLEQGLTVLDTDTDSGFGKPGSITYANQEAIRNQPLADDLYDILNGAANETGLEVRVTSGGQPSAEEGGRRTGTTNHDHGNAADFQLIDQGTGKAIPVDGSDPRVIAFAQVARGLGITGIGGHDDYMGKYTLHMDTTGTRTRSWGAKRADGTYLSAYDWITSLSNTSMSDNIKEYTAADGVQLAAKTVARRTKAAKQILTDFGITGKGAEEYLQTLDRQNAFDMERAGILAQGAERQSRVDGYRAERKVHDSELVERFKSIPEDELAAMTSDELVEKARDAFVALAGDDFEPDIVNEINAGASLQNTSAFTTLAALRGKAIANNVQANKTTQVLSSIAQYATARVEDGQPFQPSNQEVAQFYREAVANAGINPDMAFTTLVNEVELTQLQAAAEGATNANIQRSQDLTQTLDMLFQGGALNDTSQVLKNRVGALVKADAESRKTNVFKAFDNVVGMTETNDTLLAKTREFLEGIKGVALDPDGQQKLQTSLNKVADQYNEIEARNTASPTTPVPVTTSEAELVGGELIVTESVVPPSDRATFSKAKQTAAIDNLAGPMQRLQDGDESALQDVANALYVSKQMGYNEGMLSSIYEEYIGEGDITNSTVDLIADLVALSDDPYVDFAGNEELQVIASVPTGTFKKNIYSFQKLLGSNLITDAHLEKLGESMPFGSEDERSKFAVQTLANGIREITADPEKIDKIVDKLARDSKAVRIREFDIVSLLPGYVSAGELVYNNAQDALKGRDKAPILRNPGADVGEIKYKSLDITSSPSTRNTLQARFGLNNEGFAFLVSAGAEAVGSVFHEQAGEVMEGDQGPSGLNIHVSEQGVTLTRTDGQVIMSARENAPLASINLSPEGGRIPTKEVLYGYDGDSQRRHFLLEELGGETWDIRNVAGAITVIASFDDGTADQEISVMPEDFIAYSTKGNKQLKDHGMFAYMLPSKFVPEGASSVAIGIDGAILNRKQSSRDIGAVFFHMDTLVQGMQNADSKLRLSIPKKEDDDG